MSDPIRSGGKHPFEYQSPNDDQIRAIQRFRDVLHHVHDLIAKDIPSSRERSLAITKLEEASMWLNKAIVFSD